MTSIVGQVYRSGAKVRRGLRVHPGQRHQNDTTIVDLCIDLIDQTIISIQRIDSLCDLLKGPGIAQMTQLCRRPATNVLNVQAHQRMTSTHDIRHHSKLLLI